MKLEKVTWKLGVDVGDVVVGGLDKGNFENNWTEIRKIAKIGPFIIAFCTRHKLRCTAQAGDGAAGCLESFSSSS